MVSRGPHALIGDRMEINRVSLFQMLRTNMKPSSRVKQIHHKETSGHAHK